MRSYSYFERHSQEGRQEGSTLGICLLPGKELQKWYRFERQLRRDFSDHNENEEEENELHLCGIASESAV